MSAQYAQTQVHLFYHVYDTTPVFVRTRDYDLLAGILLCVTGCEALFAKYVPTSRHPACQRTELIFAQSRPIQHSFYTGVLRVKYLDGVFIIQFRSSRSHYLYTPHSFWHTSVKVHDS